jgi:hypothetical protein
LWSWQRAQPERQAQEHRPGRRRAVDRVLDQVLLGDRAALVGHDVVAQETGRDLLRVGGVGQQVAGQLLGQEPVERHVLAVGLEHPVAPQPHLAPASVWIPFVSA